MKLKFLIVGITILAWIGVIMIGTTGLAATTGTVTATVTAAIYSVQVLDAAVAYGSVALDATNDTTAGGENDLQKAGNNGNVTEKLNIQGSDSASWTLTTGDPTGEQYGHSFSTQSAAPWQWWELTTSYYVLNPSIAQANTQDFHLEVEISDNTTATAQQNVNVTVQATAP